MAMASPPPLTPLVALMFFLLISPALSSTVVTSPSIQSAKAVAFPATFLSSLRCTIDEIQQVMSVVSTFSGVLGNDLRLSSAISDCLEVLDLSSDEISWTISSSSASSTSASLAAVGTTNKRSDVQSWLSAALGNQDTCKESLSAAGGLLGSLIGSSLDGISSLLSGGLRQLSTAVPSEAPHGRKLLGATAFPKWVSAGDRKLLQATPSTGMKYDAVVAQDGSGNYTSVAAAVAAAPDKSNKRYVIYIKKGIYKENVEVKKKKWNIMLVGDGANATVISGSRNFVDGWTTYRTATLAVSGMGFIARDLTVENTAGPAKHQAVAMRSDSDLSVYFRCAFTGYQDTLYAHALRQFYRDCKISGSVDFIFGNAAAVFQSCTIVSRRALANQKNTVTAQGRKDVGQNTGFSLQFCNVTADAADVPTYLGRPWKEFSRTMFMQSYLGPALRPEGWLEWDGNLYLDTLYYGEYMNNGPGSALAGRVKWPGYHIVNNSTEAASFTVAKFIDGNLWLPSTGVKYAAGFQL